MLDHVVDQMRDDPTTLKTCCLASKSWIHRTRKLLFAHISFNASTRVESWKKTFPDPTNSPARHARSLSIRHPHLVTTADVDTITTFCYVESMDMITDGWNDERISLTPLHGLSPVLRSLYLSFMFIPDSEIFGLVCSFPLLEDFALVSKGSIRGGGEWIPPSTSPRLTGSLKLETPFEGIQSITHRLLDLPNGIHFTAIAVHLLSEQDFESTVDLVSRCAETLNTLDLTNSHYGVCVSITLRQIDSLPIPADTSGTTGIDLSQARKLQDVVFRCGSPHAKWISETLRTTGPENLQQLSLDLPHHTAIGWETVHQEWLDLDDLLVEFWATHSLRLVVRAPWKGEKELRDYVAMFLPELATRGIADLVLCVLNEGNVVPIAARWPGVFSPGGL